MRRFRSNDWPTQKMKLRKRTMKLLILVVTTFLTGFSGEYFLGNGQSTSVRLTRPKLTVELTADKGVYRPKDDIRLKVMVVNDSLLDDVSIYGELGFGYTASFTLFRRDAKAGKCPLASSTILEEILPS